MSLAARSLLTLKQPNNNYAQLILYGNVRKRQIFISMATVVGQTPEYRGYKIETDKVGDDWVISIHPSRPDLPILRQHSFRPLLFPEGESLEQAKRWIDRVLSS